MPSYSDDIIEEVYDKTRGYCLFCDIKIAYSNYGIVGAKGAWEIDHFIPISRNGAHALYNLVPACVSCNSEKSDMFPWEFDPDRFEYHDRDPSNYF